MNMPRESRLFNSFNSLVVEKLNEARVHLDELAKLSDVFDKELDASYIEEMLIKVNNLLNNYEELKL